MANLDNLTVIDAQAAVTAARDALAALHQVRAISEDRRQAALEARDQPCRRQSDSVEVAEAADTGMNRTLSSADWQILEQGPRTVPAMRSTSYSRISLRPSNVWTAYSPTLPGVLGTARGRSQRLANIVHAKLGDR